MLGDGGYELYWLLICNDIQVLVAVVWVQFFGNAAYLVQQITEVVLDARVVVFLNQIDIRGEQVFVARNFGFIVILSFIALVEKLPIVVLQYVAVLWENLALVKEF